MGRRTIPSRWSIIESLKSGDIEVSAKAVPDAEVSAAVARSASETSSETSSGNKSRLAGLQSLAVGLGTAFLVDFDLSI